MSKLEKIFAGFVITTFTVLMITGCDTKSEAINENIKNSMKGNITFEKIMEEENLAAWIATDKDTGVQYMIVGRGGGGLDIQMLVTDQNYPSTVYREERVKK